MKLIKKFLHSGSINNSSNKGHAIYLHYPNFMGETKNAIKLGNFDLGDIIGNPSIPVGHAAFILVGPNGKADYYEYGRYNSGPLIGKEKRKEVKGGNWRRIALPALQKNENDSAYMARIQSRLPDTHTGAYLAMSVSNVDTDAATKWVLQLADDKDRAEYSIFNTCATGACNAIMKHVKGKVPNPMKADNPEGYSLGAALWSVLPGSTDSYASRIREIADNVYLMNNKK